MQISKTVCGGMVDRRWHRRGVVGRSETNLDRASHCERLSTSARYRAGG